MISPLNLVQEQQLDKAFSVWRVLVVCALFNKTHGRQVRPIVDKLFERWPTPRSMRDAEPKDLEPILKPLGLYNRRIDLLKKLSGSYWQLCVNEGSADFWMSRKDASWVQNVDGCGQYAVDSVNIFFYGKLDNVSSDHWLKSYVHWKLTGEVKLPEGAVLWGT